MMNLIMNNWQNILVVLIVIIAGVVLYRQGKKKELKQMVLAIVKASDEAVDTNKLVEDLYCKLPSLIRLLISKQKLAMLIDEAIKDVENELSK